MVCNDEGQRAPRAQIDAQTVQKGGSMDQGAGPPTSLSKGTGQRAPRPCGLKPILT